MTILRWSAWVAPLLLTVACAAGVEPTAPASDSVVTRPAATLEIDARLPIDTNGLYHLVLLPGGVQTIHRISGRVSYAGQPLHSGLTANEAIRVIWESSHYWRIDSPLVVIVQRSCPHRADVLCMYEISGHRPAQETVILPQFTGMEVPTVNCCSYSAADGEVNSMFAPVTWMAGDTVEITARAGFASGEVIVRSIRIVLDTSRVAAQVR